MVYLFRIQMFFAVCIASDGVTKINYSNYHNFSDCIKHLEDECSIIINSDSSSVNLKEPIFKGYSENHMNSDVMKLHMKVLDDTSSYGYYSISSRVIRKPNGMLYSQDDMNLYNKKRDVIGKQGFNSKSYPDNLNTNPRFEGSYKKVDSSERYEQISPISIFARKTDMNGLDNHNNSETENNASDEFKSEKGLNIKNEIYSVKNLKKHIKEDIINIELKKSSKT